MGDGYSRWAIAAGYGLLFGDCPFEGNAGVDLKAIRSMHLGVGDRKHPRPDGAGMIYIDDIPVVRNP